MKFPGFLSGVLVSPMSPKIKIIGFGARGRVRKSRNHRNEGFDILQIINQLIYELIDYAHLRQSISTSFFVLHLFIRCFWLLRRVESGDHMEAA